MSIVTSREQRRQLARDNAKLPARLHPVPIHEWPATQRESRFAPTEVWRSRDFLVQVYEELAHGVVCRLSVLRTTLDPKAGRWVDGITWDELQRVKAECGFDDNDAVEVYPRDRDVVNVANLRHLWVLAEPVPFAWRSLPAGRSER